MKNVFVLLLLSADALMGQIKLPVPLNVEKLYNNATRSADGKPGKNYWQNTADYSISIQYDPVTRLVSGSEEIHYNNNSPDGLKNILLKLYPNLYQKGNVRDMAIDSNDLTEGVKIEKIIINDFEQSADKINTMGTNMMVNDVNIASKSTAKISVVFKYTLNKNSHIRTGQIEDGAAFIAYSFPRIAVYDDLDGWNRNPYLGSQEFYNDFCNFNVSVTVPANYLVWATGDLQNCNEVLNERYCERLSNAEKKDSVVFIVDENDLKQGGITKSNPVNVWKFKASNVVDFAFQ